MRLGGLQVNEHRYAKVKIGNEILLGYVYPNHKNISLDGKTYLARGIVYKNRTPEILRNLKNATVEYLT